MSETSLPIRIKPDQAIAEAAALGQKIASGAKLFEEIRDEDVAIATTPKDEVWRQDKVTLYRYRPLTEQTVKTPVLIAYGLVGRYTMADLQEDRSLVRNQVGSRVLLRDPQRDSKKLSAPSTVSRMMSSSASMCRS